MHNKSISLISIIFFAIFHFIFITFFIQIDSIQKKMNSIYNLFELSQKELNLLISLGLVVFTFVYLLIQYVIAKFLVVIFAEKYKSKIEYVFIPKIAITIINIIFISIFHIEVSWFYAFTAFCGAIFILMFTQNNTDNWKFSIIFSIPFFFDTTIQLVKQITNII